MPNLPESQTFSPVLRWETDTVALGGPGGPMNVPLQQLVNRTAYLKAQVDAISLLLGLGSGGMAAINNLTSTSTTSPLAANQGRVLKDLYDIIAAAVANKLDSSAYNDHYKGLHPNPVSLQTTHPTAISGDYALVDTGTGTDAVAYYWDVDDGWVTNGSTVSLTDTDALAEGSTNFYCTNIRVRQALVRENASVTTGAIAANAVEVGNITIATRYQLLHIITSDACRVRLYTSVNQRNADINRAIGTDPTGNHGLMFEFITSPVLLSADLSPIVDGFSGTADIPYSITNLSGVAKPITVTLNHVKTGE